VSLFDRLATVNQLLARKFVLFYGFFVVVTPVFFIIYAYTWLFVGKPNTALVLEVYAYIMVIGAIAEFSRRLLSSRSLD